MITQSTQRASRDDSSKGSLGSLFGMLDDSAYSVDSDSTTHENSRSAENVNAETSLDLSTESSFADVEDNPPTPTSTKKVHIWRFGAMIALLVTAIAVTLASYMFLAKEERLNFETAFEQFSKSIGDAAIDQQVDLRESLGSFATLWSNHARETNQEWPFVTLPRFEEYGRNFLQQSHAEVMATFMHVTKEDKEAYVNYADENHRGWVEESHMIQMGSLERLVDPNGTESYHPYITQASPNGFIEDIEREDYWPNWQYSPPPASYGWINFNVVTVPDYDAIVKALLELKNETLTTRVRKYTSIPTAMSYEEHDQLHSNFAQSSADYPHSFVFHPLHRDTTDYTSDIVGFFGVAVAWDHALLNLLPDGVGGIHAHLSNDCGQSYTYAIEGPDAIFLGNDDLHYRNYDGMGVHVNLSPHTHPNFTTTPGHCQFSMHIYPTSAFSNSYQTDLPRNYAIIVAVTFLVVAIFFFGYDILVQNLNFSLVNQAANSDAIVDSIIPQHLRERLMREKEHEMEQKHESHKKNSLGYRRASGKGDSKEVTTEKIAPATRPMADLFLETTVMFADICGFTAWSSIREPIHVFTLLENIFQAFDQVAKRRRIFKVETVGDCYVAVSGLPEPRADHAIAMVRFGRDIIARMRTLTKVLETSLGPDTGELSLRVGIHSGPVTGGVLRGERARFQLFGDTMNTAARIEASGKSNQIHCSKETAALLKKSGKDSWLERRTDVVTAKGKGAMETYWVSTSRERAGSMSSMTSASDGNQGDVDVTAATYGPKLPGLDDKTYRLIDWNVEMLLKLLKQVVARREATRKRTSFKPSVSKAEVELALMPLEEVKEIITLPALDGKAAKRQKDPELIMVPEDVVQQLHHLVSTIATFYNRNPFHNFDHASHVVMSVIKLMSRIVAPSKLDEMKDSINSATNLHDHTYGITSDPLTQFACAFSALIHDVAHEGVSNAQLVKEKAPVAKKYRNRSVAEQNSLDLSWDLLMKPQYAKLRAYVFPESAELIRFRQLVVNSVMSTDIVDRQLKALRNARWEKAFNNTIEESTHTVVENKQDEVNRKATIVIEHIIQASDISHTMQHWHVYRKWNQNLFEELYVAWLNGRMDKDPTTFWYKGEFGFFDFYIIPLTRKLKECGVFGVSSDEYLQYAQLNRAEWEIRGKEMVEEMSRDCRDKYGVKQIKEEKPVLGNSDVSV